MELTYFAGCEKSRVSLQLHVTVVDDGLHPWGLYQIDILCTELL